MYIKFKSKYKKFFWLLIGFIISCVLSTSNVKAVSSDYYDMSQWMDISEFTLPSGISPENDKIIIRKSAASYIMTVIPKDNSARFQIYQDSDVFPNAYAIKNLKSDNSSYYAKWYQANSSKVFQYKGTNDFAPNFNFKIVYTNTDIYSTNGTNKWFDLSKVNFTSTYTVNFHLNGGAVLDFSNPLIPHLIIEDYSIQTTSDELSEYLTHITPLKEYSNFIGWYYDSDFTQAYNSGDILSSNINLYAKFELYDYLQGYTKITLGPGERYVIFSSSTITSGSVYIPISDFNDYGSRISYFDNDLDTQPYTSYIQDFTTTSDGLFAKQDFDLSTYTGSDFIMFSKYIYLEGPDNFSSSVWVPRAMYSRVVDVTPNNTGGNDFDYSYVDENGELQANVISSSDLSQGSPLVSDLFTNFTTKDYGLSSIVTAPIPLLQSLNSASCSTVELPLGVFGGVHDERLSLPCMTPVYSSIFGELFTLYQTITTGVVAYFIGLAYFNKIKQLKDPDNDKIEVVDL